MRQVRHTRIALLAAAGLVAMAQSAGAAPIQYKISVPPLSVAPGSSADGAAINDRGTTAIQLYMRNATDAYRCSATVCKQLPSLGGNHFEDPEYVGGMNEAGQIAGISSHNDIRRAFLFDGRMTKDLGALDETLPSFGYGLNNVGQVVGASETAKGLRAFLWQDGRMTNLGTLGGDYSLAYAVNDSGVVVGSAKTGSGEVHAFFYLFGKMGDLGTLGGPSSSARAINQSGWVVGCADTPGSAESLAYVYRSGAMQAIKPLGGTNACAIGINREGWVVGYSNLTPGQGDYHGFLFEGSEVHDLNDTLGDDDRATWEITNAGGINKNRQIIATGRSRLDGSYRALVLTPVAP